MGKCFSLDIKYKYIQHKTILLLGLENSGKLSFINKLYPKNDTIKYNNCVYKILLSLDYNIKEFTYKFSDNIIYIIDITNKSRYEENTLELIKILGHKRNKHKNILLLINIRDKHYNLNIDDIRKLFNIKQSMTNVIIKEYSDRINRQDILKMIENL